MKKNHLYVVLCIFCAFSFSLRAQYKEISGRELEIKIFLNNQQGSPSFKDLFVEYSFQFEDYSKLTTSFDLIKNELDKNFQVILYQKKDESKQLIVTLDKTEFSSDEFLKVFKDILERYGVYLHDYQEKTVVIAGK